jgi:hypothetical protein
LRLFDVIGKHAYKTCICSLYMYVVHKHMFPTLP